MSQKWVKRHQRVKKFLDEYDSPCISISTLAKELGMDPRTARAHLEVMQVDRVGAFTDDSKNVFCRKEVIAEFARRFTELAKKLEYEEDR